MPAIPPGMHQSAGLRILSAGLQPRNTAPAGVRARQRLAQSLSPVRRLSSGWCRLCQSATVTCGVRSVTFHRSSWRTRSSKIGPSAGLRILSAGLQPRSGFGYARRAVGHIPPLQLAYALAKDWPSLHRQSTSSGIGCRKSVFRELPQVQLLAVQLQHDGIISLRTEFVYNVYYGDKSPILSPSYPWNQKMEHPVSDPKKKGNKNVSQTNCASVFRFSGRIGCAGPDDHRQPFGRRQPFVNDAGLNTRLGMPRRSGGTTQVSTPGWSKRDHRLE